MANLQTLVTLGKVTAAHKTTLNTLEQLLTSLQAEIQREQPKTAEQLAEIINRPQFSALTALVNHLVSPFSTPQCD